MPLFRQLFDPASSTYTYLLANAGEAVLIDPVFEQARRDAALLRELDVLLVATLDTHVHADHVTGAWLLKQRCGSAIAVSKASGAAGADRVLVDGDRIAFGGRHLTVRATPGHTDGCLTYVLDDRSMAFTGDALLIRGSGRTDFQQGDAATLYRSVREQIFSLPDECLLYPAHDYRGLTVTSVGEERRFNPRLGEGVMAADFVGYMQHLGLPHPKQMAIAVPANLRCGQTVEASALPPEAPWPTFTLTFAGMFEIAPAALAEADAPVQIIDVREPEELRGELGRIANAVNIPLAQLTGRAGELDRATPIVTVCRSGARSAQAAVLLGRAGFANVANMAGGMLRWRGEGLPVAAR